jgi:hypothetical protein
LRFGAWFHSGDNISLDTQIVSAAACGLQTIRCYDIGYAQSVVPVLKQTGMSLLAGMDVDAAALLDDWRSQVRLDELARYHELGVPLEGVCVGNELREGRFESTDKKFSARLSFRLANVLAIYRKWLDDHHLATPLTYANEGIVFDGEGRFHEWMWPLIDACDVVSINLYPMDYNAWFTFGAFEESRRLLQDTRERHLRFALYELRLRRILEQLAQVSTPLCLTETGFPSAVAYQIEGEDLVVPQSDNANFAKAMNEFIGLVHRVNQDYDDKIYALYFYEWRDNLHHGAIESQSPIHTAFGLCDRSGAPKFDISSLTSRGNVEGENARVRRRNRA